MTDAPENDVGDGDGDAIGSDHTVAARQRFSARPAREPEGASSRPDTTPGTIEAMLELAADAAMVVSGGWEFFDSADGRLSRHAADAIVIKFHELCDRLSPEVRDRHPTVPWEQIRGMRNRLGHQYQSSDHRIVWNTLRTELPAVVEQLASERA
ncbi:hypothetical protein C5B96_16495 [Subtercola sp. Z020]|uniref:HepT-like ribonuclease domain-containing protein n=1 Tax=Subtercola sp. Z020 TaxID=2080582 RepID=UPI000CE82791|nr:HepT-like ribonuclease domain-containing protein [Subtercola sp. Z020]PPF76601.1 hypothetical protein C5B96_16495 [Subtercola sp. Z020]